MHIQDFRLERYFAQYEFTAPYLLCSSDSESWQIKDLLALEPGADEAFQELWLGYTEPAGHPELRHEIDQLYTTQPQVLVHVSAQEAIFNFMNATLESGHHVIVQTPCYQSLSELPQALGCSVSFWEAQGEAQWALDLEVLTQSIRPNTRAIILNLPHNPTGYLMSRETLQAIVDIARHHDLWLFCDEINRFSEHRSVHRLPPVCDLYEKGVSVGGLSKPFGLAGLRIGWTATRDEALHRRLSAFKDYTSICNSAPSEFLAQLALKHKTVLLERNLDIIQANRHRLEAFFNAYSDLFHWVPPHAGTMAFPRLLREEDSDAFCHRLVMSQGVLLLPGSLYGASYRRHFRIGFGRRNFPEALQRFEEFVQSTCKTPTR